SSLTSGPGKLTQALSIASALNGLDMTDPDSELHIEFGSESARIFATRRIGITRATDKEWRFLDPSRPYVSRKIQIKALSPDGELELYHRFLLHCGIQSRCKTKVSQLTTLRSTTTSWE